MANIYQAAKWLSSGKRVRRSAWSNAAYQLVIDGIGTNSVICVDGNALEPVAGFNVSDLTAGDWELAYEDRPRSRRAQSTAQLGEES